MTCLDIPGKRAAEHEVPLPTDLSYVVVWNGAVVTGSEGQGGGLYGELVGLHGKQKGGMGGGA
jgi:hypothetical protein